MHKRKVNWIWLSRNRNAIHLLEQQVDKLDWCYLSDNENAMDLLEQHIETKTDLISWEYLSKNPNIFRYDYGSMQARCDLYREELMAHCFQPNNFGKFASWGFGLDD